MNTQVEENTKSIDEDIDGDEGISENQFLTFALASETYGINILNVMEIIRMIKITDIPETFDFIKGIINLRGKIIPVMDVRIRFNIAEKEYGDRTCIIVINVKGVEMGLIVDNVNEVMEIPDARIEGMPSVSNSSHQRFVKGIGKTEGRITILLDLEKMLFDDDMKKFMGKI